MVNEKASYDVLASPTVFLIQMPNMPVNICPFTLYFIHCVMKTESFGFVMQHEHTHTNEVLDPNIVWWKFTCMIFVFGSGISNLVIVSRHVCHFHIYFTSHSKHLLLVSHFLGFWYLVYLEILWAYNCLQSTQWLYILLFNILELANGVVEVIIIVIIIDWVWIPYIQLWITQTP